MCIIQYILVTRLCGVSHDITAVLSYHTEWYPKVVIVFCPVLTTQNGKTPLMRAAKWGYNDIIQKLLKYGAGVNIQDRVSRRPCTLLHVCVVYCVA